MNDEYSDAKDIERRLQEDFLVGAEAMKRRDEGNDKIPLLERAKDR